MTYMSHSLKLNNLRANLADVFPSKVTEMQMYVSLVLFFFVTPVVAILLGLLILLDEYPGVCLQNRKNLSFCTK